MIGYKEILILHYFYSVGASYSYNELLRLFGFQYEQLDSLINDLLNDELLVIDSYLKLTPRALMYLEENNLTSIEYDNVEGEEIFVDKPLSINEIYIPRKFDSKFK
ncbi:hypothetical protein ACFUP3_19430 [Bacillus paralicheniformis]|uniref:hypothetical protein n=1 Tax=Bacillus paralicheniformis TaxID=1648923 RepID=UPI0036276B42